MKFYLILFILFISATANIYSSCNIQQEYQKMFKISKHQYNEREYLLRDINNLDSNSCFADLVNNNEQYIDYLLSHFSDYSNYDKWLLMKDSIARQNEFIQNLENDSLFNTVMDKLTFRISQNKPYTLDTVSMDELMDIAVKYFEITEIRDDGRLVGKICAGFNGIISTEEVRKPQVEAFCFSTIINNYKNEKFNLFEEFVHGIQELYLLNLGIDKNERLLRAQGAIYLYMRNNKILRDLLIIEFNNKKQYLPFTLTIQ